MLWVTGPRSLLSACVCHHGRPGATAPPFPAHCLHGLHGPHAPSYRTSLSGHMVRLWEAWLYLWAMDGCLSQLRFTCPATRLPSEMLRSPPSCCVAVRAGHTGPSTQQLLVKVDLLPLHEKRVSSPSLEDVTHGMAPSERKDDPSRLTGWSSISDLTSLVGFKDSACKGQT